MRNRERQKLLDEERWIRRLARKGKQYNRYGSAGRGKSIRKNKQNLINPSRILDLFHPFTPFKKRSPQKQKWFKVPSNFSISKNSKETLRFYRSVVKYARTAKVPKLLLDHRRVEYLGLAADSVLGIILKEISKECRGRRGAYVRGWKANKPDIRKLMDRIGCVHAVKDHNAEAMDIEVNMKSKTNVFRYRNMKEYDVVARQLDKKSAISRDFSNHLDKCLGNLEVRKRLTDKGRSDILEYVGEIVSNAQEHSGTAEWLIAGYIDLEDPGLTYRCTIVSFGDTFASTFLSLKPDSFAYRDVDQYVERHRVGGFFSKVWRKEDLISVMALQGDVSCKNVDHDSTRGQGTVDFIEFFQDVSSSCSGYTDRARMTVLTGSTKISFDGKYRMVSVPPHGRKTIAFNESNDLLKRPDVGAVLALDDVNFPGVVISIAAPLASVMVETSNGQNDEN